ncbi:MAG: diacylglycerol kinase [bacterium]
MDLKKQKDSFFKNKKFGVKRIIRSIQFSYQGLVHAYKYEQSLWLHAISILIVVPVGFLLQISFNEWALVIMSSLFILSIELLNTAIEATVDMVTKEYNQYAKTAKDCGSAAAAVASFAHIAILVFVFAEKLIGLVIK